MRRNALSAGHARRAAPDFRRGCLVGSQTDIGGQSVAVAFELKQVAGRGFVGRDRQIVSAHDRGQGQHAGKTDVAELVLEAADRHIGELTDCVLDHVRSAQFHFVLTHAQHQPDGMDRKLLGEAKIDRSVDVSRKPDRVDDLISRYEVGLPRLTHQGDITTQHRLADISDGLKNGFLDDGVGDLLDSGHAGVFGKDRIIGSNWAVLRENRNWRPWGQWIGLTGP